MPQPRTVHYQSGPLGGHVVQFDREGIDALRLGRTGVITSGGQLYDRSAGRVVRGARIVPQQQPVAEVKPKRRRKR